MNPKWIAFGAFPLAALSVWAATPVDAQDARVQVQADGRTGLVRVAPLAPPAAPPTGAQQDPVEEFSPDLWLYRLSDPDLDRREEFFDEILRKARREPAAKQWLEERARDTVDPELSWTARMALRELRQRGGGLIFRSPGSGPQSIFQMNPRFGQLQQRLERLMDGTGLHVMPGGMSGGDWTTESQGVSVQQDENGVRVTVTEQVDGEEKRTVYEGATMEELLEAHPELEDRIGGRNPVFQFRSGPNGSWGDVDGIQLELESLFGRDPFDRDSPAPVDDSASAPIRTDILGVYLGRPDSGRLRELGLAEGTGLAVLGAEPGTIAHVLGLSRGDLLVRLNGVELRSRDQVSEILAARSAEGEVKVVWYDHFGDRRRQTWKPAE